LVPTIDYCYLAAGWAVIIKLGQCCGSYEEDSMHAYFKVTMRLGMAGGGVHIYVNQVYRHYITATSFISPGLQ